MLSKSDAAINSKNNNDTLILYGCGGHARSMADVALSNGIQQLIFVDPNALPNELMLGFAVMSEVPAAFSINNSNSIVAIGDNQSRAEVFNALLAKQQIAPLIANDAYLGKNCQIDAGVFIGRAAHIGPNVRIGENSIINTHALIEHDCIIGKHCHISVNSTVAGKCTVGDYVMVGAGATLIDGITLGSSVIIGAGAVVVKDILEPGTYVGVPARKIRE